MPTYEYKCNECGCTFEEVHGVGDTVECSPCCGGGVRRVFHPVGIIFKGSGFYKTDNRDAGGNGGGNLGPDRVEKEVEKPADKPSSEKKKKKKDPAPEKDAVSSS